MQFAVNGRVLYTPTPKQVEFHLCPARYPLFGGSAGPGKSYGGRWDVHMVAMAVPRTRQLVLRRTFGELESTHIQELKLRQEDVALGATWSETKYQLTLPNGSIEVYGHCQHNEDVSKHLSTNYDRILFDELVTFSEYQYLMIGSRCRTTIPGFKPQVKAVSNPGGKHAQWVRKRWIWQDMTRDDDPTYDPADYRYLPCTYLDNPYLDHAEYERFLSRLPGRLAQAYRDGNWELFEGQFFDEFDRSRHVVSGWTLPAGATVVGGLDWGYSAPGCMLWAGQFADGRVCILDEWKFNGPRGEKWIAADVAREIVRRTRDRGWKLQVVYADPKMFSVEGHHLAESVADAMRKAARLPLRQANNERALGAARIRAWLRPDESGTHPSLVFDGEYCPYLCRTLPALVMDLHEPEKYQTDNETDDHGADALRYLCMGLHPPRSRVTGPTPAEFSLARMRGLLNKAPGVLGRGKVRRRLSIAGL